jgi:hypothetical protein
MKESEICAPGRGGGERDPETIPTHDFPGATDETLLQNAVTMDVSGDLRDGQVVVGVTVTNDKTGHHVPKGSPLRHLILLVEATGPSGIPPSQPDGPTVPDWGGVGDPAQGHYAGLPGTVYAKVLQEWETELAPTGAYWNRTRLLSDNRIPAMGSDTTTYTFDAAEVGAVGINAKLLFRRAFIQLMRQKGWDVPDILMARKSLVLEPQGMVQRITPGLPRFQ